ncbi:hypothetical protein A2645_01150 [Candidatus Nomurabacteria bacterium RIFCSPHIGHO2_01_FULL_39_9]|uniref:Ribulose-phosphate 3-epimerase n=1 Tax=Candidatus Nomurabacteria bacterium RIFCSPHIGHO2_01_FULL_39_9 TaxID=1801735 RepID=A0A1F6UW85_9BACT|nr:MAG: hypothetical protein A2645_01150 [Candidatus Nomurabacteria bacterium RIFCSPHIGHO2_01_FULL_39_9]
MNEIIPAIMPKNYEDLKYKVSLVKGLVSTVQLDLMDGVFVPEKTWPFLNLKQGIEEVKENGLPFWQDLDFELDLMVRNASNLLEELIQLGPSRIIFHIEAEDTLNIKKIKERLGESIEIGLAINPQTSIEKIEPFISDINFVQCMGIAKIGYQGQPFDEKVFDHINYLQKNYPKLTISVDGSVNFDTIGKLTEAGVSRFVIGSAIFGAENIHKTIEEFYGIIKK